jgi:hypothetical protein
MACTWSRTSMLIWNPKIHHPSTQAPTALIPELNSVQITYMFTNLFLKIMLIKSWVLAPCELVGQCQRFGETRSLHLQELKWQGREVEGLYGIRTAKAEGREQISGRQYGKGCEPKGSLQACYREGGWVGSGGGEESRPFQGSSEGVFLFEAGLFL